MASADSATQTLVPESQTPGRCFYGAFLAIFAASRAIYFLLGLRFDASGLSWFFQFADPVLLRERLLETLFYLHIQPPGYNLYLGLILKLFPHSYAAAFHVMHLLFGAVTGCALLYLMLRFGVRPRLSFALVSLFAITPGVVLFENFILYEYLLSLLLALSAVFLYRFLEQRGAVWAVCFLAAQFCVVMVRNMYHLAYFALIVAAAVYLTHRNRRIVATCGGVFFALVLGVYVKNYILFGQFVSSTWLGMNMSTIAIHHLTAPEWERLVASGEISPATVNPGAPIAAYAAYIHMPEKTGVPVLDNEQKSGGAANFNHAGFLEVQKLYMKDGLYLIRHYPEVYLRSLTKAWFAYFLPTGDFPFFGENRARIEGLNRAVNVVLFGQFLDASNRKALRRQEAAGAGPGLILFTGLYLLVGLPALVIFGVWYAWRGVRRRTLPLASALTLGFMLFNILYLTAVANFLSCFENNRYRFPIDGFYLVLAALALEHILRRVGRRTAAGHSSGSTA